MLFHSVPKDPVTLNYVSDNCYIFARMANFEKIQKNLTVSAEKINKICMFKFGFNLIFAFLLFGFRLFLRFSVCVRMVWLITRVTFLQFHFCYRGIEREHEKILKKLKSWPCFIFCTSLIIFCYVSANVRKF